MKRFFIVIIVLVMIILIAFPEKKIYVIAEIDGTEKIITSAPVRKNIPLVINFIHSVQKTPVTEELIFDGENFILLRTKYKSHGVGLPFLDSDGDFRQEDGFFIMDNMNRVIKNLELRTGEGTQLQITLDGNNFKLYQELPTGVKIKFVIK